MTWKFEPHEIIERDGSHYVVIECYTGWLMTGPDGEVFFEDPAMYTLAGPHHSYTPIKVQKDECEMRYESTGQRAEATAWRPWS